MGLRRLALTWHALGRDDPLWAVLTHPEKRGGKWERAPFFATGRAEIAAALDDAVALVPDLAFTRALDFGCGVGRLTQALAERFTEVHGVDIAASMLERARALDRSGGRCTFHLNRRPDLRLFAAGTFDFAYSAITLQHIPPRYALRYVAELLRVVRPEGLAVFQLAAEKSGRPALRARLGRAAEVLWRHHVLRQPVMEMFGLPPARVRATVAAARGRILAQREDESAGPAWSSYRYTVAPAAAP